MSHDLLCLLFLVTVMKNTVKGLFEAFTQMFWAKSEGPVCSLGLSRPLLSSLAVFALEWSECAQGFTYFQGNITM